MPTRSLGKLVVLPTALAFTSCSMLAASRTDERLDAKAETRLSLSFGMRGLDEDDYEPVEGQPVLGIEFVRETPGSTVGWELGAMGSRDEDDFNGLDVEGWTAELYGGIRKSFRYDNVRPYLGGGFAYIHSEIDVAGASEKDGALAGYLHGGVTFDLTESLFLGIDVRVLLAPDPELADVETDLDYQQYALVLGFAL